MENFNTPVNPAPQMPPSKSPVKKILLIILGIIIIGIVVCFAMRENTEIKPLETNNEISDWKTYTNEQFGFEIKIPTSWITETDGTKATSFNSPENYKRIVEGRERKYSHGLPQNLIVIYHDDLEKKGILDSKAPGTDALEEYVVQSKDFFHNPQQIIFADQPAYRGYISGLYDIDGIWVQRNNHMYEIWLESDIGMNSDLSAQILSTFKFTPLSQNWDTNTFTASNIEVGQKIGAMTVEKFSPAGENFGPENKGRPISDDNILVEFSGTVTLVGTLTAPTGRPEDAGVGPEYALSNLIPESLEKLPYLRKYSENIWFGIRNPEIIINAGLKNRDKVELTINKYYYISYPAEVWNEANVVTIQKIN